MCLICDHFNRDQITLKEAWMNLGEMYDSLDKEHRKEVVESLWHETLDSEEEIDPETWGKIFQGILVKYPN